MSRTYFEKYAQLIVKKGVNVVEGEVVVISAPIESASFTKIVVKYAYEAGASQVVVNWIDDDLTKMRFEYEKLENFESTPEFVKIRSDYYDDLKACYIFLRGDNPDNLNDIDPEKISANAKSMYKAVENSSKLRMADKLKWTICGVPTKAWANKVFDNKPDSYEKLWVEILKTVRIDYDNPLAAWDSHLEMLSDSAKYLTSKGFEKIVFTNSLGTNLEVKMIDNHQWISGASVDPNGVDFVCNMPTEEIFCAPDRLNVNGKVYATKPLNYQGSLITEMYFEFKDGKVIDFDATQNKEVLAQMLDQDEGARMLGEVALVNHDSQISNSNILYYCTLFDENASCHLALGRAYPTCVKDSDKMDAKQMLECGLNDSSIHVDFMFGSEDMKIVGIKNEEEFVFFENGNFIKDLK